jgi:hypothetical protein
LGKEREEALKAAQKEHDEAVKEAVKAALE